VKIAISLMPPLLTVSLSNDDAASPPFLIDEESPTV